MPIEEDKNQEIKKPRLKAYFIPSNIPTKETFEDCVVKLINKYIDEISE